MGRGSRAHHLLAQPGVMGWHQLACSNPPYPISSTVCGSSPFKPPASLVCGQRAVSAELGQAAGCAHHHEGLERLQSSTWDEGCT